MDIKNRYLEEIRVELEKLRDSTKSDVGKAPTDYVYRTGIITGLEKAINLIKEYE